MIAPSGTFDYQVIVPETRSEGSFECKADTRNPVVRSGSKAEDDRLVGISPQVRITDAGPPSAPGLKPPWSLRKRSCITLVATAQDQASVAEASFYIDKTFTDCAKAGDQMHLSRDASGGLAFSLIRGGKLVAAAGALQLCRWAKALRFGFPTISFRLRSRCFKDATRILNLLSNQWR